MTVLVAVGILGCSGSITGDDGASDAATAEEGADAGDGASWDFGVIDSSQDADAEPLPEDVACWQQYPDVTDCMNCCGKTHSVPQSTYDKIAAGRHDCVCGSSGACTSICDGNEICAQPPVAIPHSACDTCYLAAIGPAGACYSAIVAACEDDEVCLGYLKCRNGCAWHQ